MAVLAWLDPGSLQFELTAEFRRGFLTKMTSLDELLKMPPWRRQHRLISAHDALLELGVDGGVAWLEKHLDQTVGPEWGAALYRLRAEWRHIDRWLKLDKLHCIAAIDALDSYSAAKPPPNSDSPEMPKGADPLKINTALDSALSSFGNPRIEKAARHIRHVWPMSPRKAIKVTIPTPLQKVAQHLFGKEEDLFEQWETSMSTEFDPPSSSLGVYCSLLSFADEHDAVAIVDWKESGDNIVGRVRKLKSATGLEVPWDKIDVRDAETLEAISAISGEASKFGKMMVCLDQGNDDYPLVFLSDDEIRQLTDLLNSVDDLPDAVVWTFDPDEDWQTRKPKSPAANPANTMIAKQAERTTIRSRTSTADETERPQSLPWYWWVLMVLGFLFGILWQAYRTN